MWSLYTCVPKPQLYKVRFLRYRVRQTEFFVILSHFLPFYPLTTWKIEILKKWKNHPEETSPFYTCTKNHDHMMYPSWDMECDRQNSLPSHFLTLYPTNKMKNHNFGKMKKRHEISFFFTCVPQTTIIWCMVPENGARQTEFLSFWTSFCLFTPLTTQKTKILKKWKKRLEILSLYKGSRKSYNVWFLRHGARQTEFFLILDHFLPFCTLNNPKSRHFVKMEKRPGDMIILHKCTKNHDHMLYCS